MNSSAAQIRIAPSVLAADYWQLSQQLKAAEENGADRFHIDVMDGHFVPNLSFGPTIVRSLRPHTNLPLQTHLMVANPDDFLPAFADAGSDAFVVHQEGNVHLHRTVQLARELGKQIAVALNPATPADSLETILPELDEVLVMTVSPGFGGQSFIPRMLGKIEQVRAMMERSNPHCKIAVDGGIDVLTAPQVVAAGAQILVAGSAIFHHEAGVAAAMNQLRDARGERASPNPRWATSRGSANHRAKERLRNDFGVSSAEGFLSCQVQ